ncbi:MULTISPECIES: transglycosylase family protein [Brevibacterium]|uniref:transglycosylase family protein n=1 Tax=Brevibacterium TaxID=1696 RepID=UPI0022B7A625|nr:MULTISPECIES: transglycosylase family protein [Brevibacterium]
MTFVRHAATTLRRTALLTGVGAIAAAGLVGLSPPAQAAESESVWDRVADCESGGDWSINTGNGYYGGLQFSEQTWKAFGGEGMPHEASKQEQIRIAQKTLAEQGPGAWPTCGEKAGLTKETGAADDGGGSGGSDDSGKVGLGGYVGSG